MITSYGYWIKIRRRFPLFWKKILVLDGYYTISFPEAKTLTERYLRKIPLTGVTRIKRKEGCDLHYSKYIEDDELCIGCKRFSEEDVINISKMIWKTTKE